MPMSCCVPELHEQRWPLLASQPSFALPLVWLFAVVPATLPCTVPTLLLQAWESQRTFPTTAKFNTLWTSAPSACKLKLSCGDMR
eukprot:5006830-Amphidinium_carterae.1